MFRALAAMRRSVRNVKKSPRVADESMFGAGVINNVNGDEFGINNIVQRLPRGGGGGGGGWGGVCLSVILSVVRAPLSILSCFSHPQVSGADGVWVSGEFAQISEMNHLMVNDSMRYAILM